MARAHQIARGSLRDQGDRRQGNALTKKLELSDNPSGALVDYMVNTHSLGSSTIEALYRRD
ncbi:hypothetical protein [Zobellella aerophila]